MHRKLLAAVGAAVASLLFWMVLDGRAERRAAERQLSELQARLEALGSGSTAAEPAAPSALSAAELAALARREARAELQQALADAPEGQREPAPPRPPPVTLEQSQRAVLGAFTQEVADAEWSSDAAQELETIVRGRLPAGSRLGSVDCRTTMCQIEVAHADERAAQAFLMDGFGDWPGSRFVAGQRQEAGEQVVTIIASRQGHEPPIAPR